MASILDRIHASGLTLRVTGNRLIADNAHPLTERQRLFICQHKAALLQALTLPPTQHLDRIRNSQSEPDTASPLLPADRRCGQCVHFSPNPHEPPLGGCSMHERIQHQDSQPTFFGCGEFELREVRS